MTETDKSENGNSKPLPVVTLSLLPEPEPTPDEIRHWKRVNWGHGIYSGATAFIAVLWLINKWLVCQQVVLWHRSFPSFALAVVTVFLVDAYLLCMLIIVALRCKSAEEVFPRIPDRGPAVGILLLLFVALVLSFARINQHMSLTQSTEDSLYEAFMTVATLHHESYVPGSGWPHATVVGELLSVMLLLLVFFPLLVARLAMFKGETLSPQKMKFRLQATTAVTWEIHDVRLKPRCLPSDVLNVSVDEMGNIEPF